VLIIRFFAVLALLVSCSIAHAQLVLDGQLVRVPAKVDMARIGTTIQRCIQVPDKGKDKIWWVLQYKTVEGTKVALIWPEKDPQLVRREVFPERETVIRRMRLLFGEAWFTNEQWKPSPSGELTLYFRIGKHIERFGFKKVKEEQ